ncbi:hypothetical protein JL898_12360 [Staphylococcus pseudintermedius]|nr:hypothetical protein [Staphylococcus pseudintermedius]
MAIQLEIIDGRLDSTQSIYNFETLVNSFLRTHTIIDVEYKTIERTIQQTNIKTVIQVAYITYDDNLDKTWKGIFNEISGKGYSYKELLKAFLKVTDLDISEETANALADYYDIENLARDLAKEINIDYKVDQALKELEDNK